MIFAQYFKITQPHSCNQETHQEMR